jgi:acetyl-CoA carboxylase carboxyl transferase subunit beta
MKRARTWLGSARRRRPQVTCLRCGFNLEDAPQYREWRVCDNCGHHFPLDAHERIKTLADPNTFHELEKFLFTHPRGIEYARRVRDAKRRTHLRESVVVGRAKIRDRDLMLVVLDFRFLGGTMGAAAGEKVARAFEHASEFQLPLVAVTATGGARIQEGLLALMQMAKTAAAVNQFQQLGLPYISILTNPTTGGVYASFASLADVILAEPHALIGFAGPRVVEILTREKLPPDSHRAEFLLEHGMLDGVVPRPALRTFVGQLLNNVSARSWHAPGAESGPSGVRDREEAPTSQAGDEDSYSAALPAEESESAATNEAWQSVQLARHSGRPTTQSYIDRIFTNFCELHGDHLHGDDPAILAGVAMLELDGTAAGQVTGPVRPPMVQGVMVIGQERGQGDERERRRGGRSGPDGYRKARRVMELASRWNLPLITFVDTPGAEPGYEAEQGGIAMSLAQSISTMLRTRTPTIAVVIGEGGSGGALALAAADRVLMLEHAVYSVISPEGASAILYGDDAHAAELADDLRLTARDLRDRGLIDAIVPEPPGGAHTDISAAAAQLGADLQRELRALLDKPASELLDARYRKYRKMGRA